MELDIIKLRTTWNDAAGSINSNYAKIADAIAQLKANGGGGGISELTSKMVVDALGYTPYNANNPANYITSAALTPYLKTEDAEETYATKDFVNNKLVNYAPLTSVQGFENRIGGLEGAVPQLNARVETVESKVSSLNETVSTGENNLLDRVNVIEEEYATKTYVDNAIDGIDLSAYLLKADLTKSRIKSTLGISDWALAATKPSYAWSEITSRPTALSQFTDDVVSGKYLPLSGGTLSNAAWRSQLTIERSGSANDSVIAFKNSNGLLGCLGYRGADGIPCLWLGETGAGAPIIHANNIDSYNAGSATKLQTPRSIWGKSFDGTGNITGHLWSDTWRIVTDATFDGAFFQSKNYDGTSNAGNIYLTGWDVSTLDSFNVKATNSIFSGNIISPRFETTAFSASTPKRKAALDSGGLIVYGADNSGWASGIYIYNPDDNTIIGAIAAAFGSSSYTPQFYYYGGAYNDPFLKIYQTDRRIISSGLFMNIGKEISPYASNRTEIALINPNAEPSMLRLGSNGDAKWSIETRGSTDNYAFSIYSWTAATHCLRILNNGNVGIGNTSPAERLDVLGNIKADGNINATSVTIGGVTLSWDSVNNALVVNGNMYGTGSITAKKSA
ncbi:MAG: hypothetical protein U0K68_01350 [Agathobacter sp.]|nr:hypothetical protein [Agathobacter sp.]